MKMDKYDLDMESWWLVPNDYGFHYYGYKYYIVTRRDNGFSLSEKYKV